jgi:GDP-L-fucose synthase
MKNYSGESFLNIGTGQDMTIVELARTIARIIDWQCTFTFDSSKPDGTPRKVMDVSRLRSLGWSAKTDFDSGVKQAYEWYLANAVKR